MFKVYRKQFIEKEFPEIKVNRNVNSATTHYVHQVQRSRIYTCSLLWAFSTYMQFFEVRAKDIGKQL